MPTVMFDMLGTFFSLEPLRQRLTALGAPEHTLELWFSEALRDYFALSHAGGYAPLSEVLAAALPRTLAEVGKGSQDPSRHELVLKGLRVLNPAEGAQEAVAMLSAAGFRLVALTNGSLEHTRALLERAGMLDKFCAIHSADEARTSKPHPDVYALAAQDVDGEAWLVASHAWDVMGAKRAGMKTAWVSKKEKRFLSAFAAPEVEAQDLSAAARALVERVGAGAEVQPQV